MSRPAAPGPAPTAKPREISALQARCGLCTKSFLLVTGHFIAYSGNVQSVHKIFEPVCACCATGARVPKQVHASSRTFAHSDAEAVQVSETRGGAFLTCVDVLPFAKAPENVRSDATRYFTEECAGHGGIVSHDVPPVALFFGRTGPLAASVRA